MYTGLQLSTDLDIEARQTIAGAYFAPARKQWCTKQAIIKIAKNYFPNNGNQGVVDAISATIKSYNTFVPYNNKVLLKPLHISDITNTTGSVYRVTFDREHNFDFVNFPNIDIEISDVQGFVGFNANTYVATVSGTTPLTSVLITQAGVTGTYTAGSGQATGDYWLSEYYHLLSVLSEHKILLPLTIVKVKVGAQPTITVGTNNLRDDDYLVFSGFGGITGLTGRKYITKKSDREFILYDDAARTTESTITGTYTSGGVIERVTQEPRPCETLYPNQDGDYYNADYLFPLVKTDENRMEVFTSLMNRDTSITQLNYYVNYMQLFTDVNFTNTTIDLLQYFNQEMWHDVVFQAVQIFLGLNTEAEAMQTVAATQ